MSRVPLMRIRCGECESYFSQTNKNQRNCPPCRRGKQPRPTNAEFATARAVQARTPHDPRLTLTEVQQRLDTALKPFYGRPETAPIIAAILGVFTEAKEQAA
jgi:hypothetical protein